YKLKLATAEDGCEVEAIERVIDPATLVAAAGNSVVRQHEIAELVFRVPKAIAFDAFDEVASTGRFVIVDGCDVVGLGIVQASRRPTERIGAVRRNGHAPGGVLWLTGAPGPGKRKIAAELKRALADRGRNACVLDDESIAAGLCSDLTPSPD